jgi:hypothetical protein
VGYVPLARRDAGHNSGETNHGVLRPLPYPLPGLSLPVTTTAGMYTPAEYQGIPGGPAFDYASLADYEQPNTNEEQHGGQHQPEGSSRNHVS